MVTRPRLLIAAALLGAWPSLHAQGVSGGTPPTLPLRADTSGIEVQLLGTRAGTRRAFLANGAVTRQELALRGVYATVQGRSSGVQVRYADGAGPSGTVRDVDARLLVGDEQARLEMGYVQRAVPERRDTTASLVRMGLRIVFPIGGSGGRVEIGGGGLVGPVPNRNAARGARRNDIGWDGEATFHYRLSRWNVPAALMVGYRMGVLRLATQEEELGQLIIGAGLHLAGR